MVNLTGGGKGAENGGASDGVSVVDFGVDPQGGFKGTELGVHSDEGAVYVWVRGEAVANGGGVHGSRGERGGSSLNAGADEEGESEAVRGDGDEEAAVEAEGVAGVGATGVRAD